MSDALPTAYRPCVGICLINAAGDVFVGQRRDNISDAWQMPQGGIDKGEEPEQAAWREMLEEIGTNRARLLTSSSDWLHYELPVELIPRLWNGKYRGQKQLWFLFAFEGTDADINIQTDEPEFSAWKWSPLEQVAEQIVGFKRDLYVQVADGFRSAITAHAADQK